MIKQAHYKIDWLVSFGFFVPIAAAYIPPKMPEDISPGKKNYKANRAVLTDSIQEKHEAFIHAGLIEKKRPQLIVNELIEAGLHLDQKGHVFTNKTLINYVYDTAAKHGIKLESMQKTVSDLYDKGLSIEQIELETSYNYEQIRRALKIAGKIPLNKHTIRRVKP